MKVLLINGSPRKGGNTFLALGEVAKTLMKNGIETEIVQIGTKPVRGCIACGQCARDSWGAAYSTTMSATALLKRWSRPTLWS